MRTPYEQSTGSATPIYDSLCAEYRQLFRALPGDRSGEEEMRFTAFGPTHGGSGATVGGAGGWQVYTRHAVSSPAAFASLIHAGHTSHSGHASLAGHHAHSSYASHYGYATHTQSRAALPAALPPAR